MCIRDSHLLERLPWVERRARRVFGTDGPLVYVPEPAGGADDAAARMVMRPLAVRVSGDKARRGLGYRPAVPRERALALTLDWARYARLV
jgi:nucleoside-diphosphate-sugar epimerase